MAGGLMAASAEPGDGPARAGLRRLLVAVCASLAVIGASYGASVSAQADDGVIYVDAAQGYSSADLGATLLHSLADRFKFTLARPDSDRETIERIATNPHSIGLVQRDFFVQYMRDHPGSETSFEFYGDIPVCVLAVVRKEIGRASCRE